MRIAVMGTGGTGGYFGGLLARAKHDVTFIARGPHLQAIRARGLRVESRIAGNFTVAATATDDPSTVAPVDLVLFCVKAYDTMAAAQQIRPLVGSESIVLSVQNGIDNADKIAAVVGERAMIGGLAYVVSALEAPGTISQTAGAGKIVLGELDGEPSDRVEQLAGELRDAGITTQVRPDIRVGLWEKFVFICGFSGVTTLTRVPIGTVLANPSTSAFMREAMDEAEAVGRGNGVALPAGAAESAFRFAGTVEPWGHGSMYTDLVLGRKLELESLNGAVVRLGRARRIATPANDAIAAGLAPYVDGAPAQIVH